MKAYYLLCGAEYFCFPPYKTHQWEILPNLSYRHFNVCPECQCDNACIQRGDCCADLYFSFPHLNCVNRTIINGRYEKDQTEQYSALMVDSCPVGSSKELKEKCSSLNDTKSRLKHYPVTGNELPLTFYNIFCAKCNNVLNFTSWSLDINCSLFADFNYLTTLDEVVDLAIERRCIFQAYKKDDEFGESKEENCFDIDGSQTIITKCNQTSEWIVYDGNIAYACESFFKGNYRFFKNVFCYMCNPSGHEFMTNTIATCNVTGEWLIQDSGLQQACTDLPMSFSTAPFKNIFCYLCNRGNDSSHMFVDIMGKVNEFPIEDIYFHFQYDLYIADFNLQYFTA
ncbi:hypothetical protein FSP39_001862 [Pinctada imbricata]|uniref:SMB domain-containing protein n=1 Tax=Pinctada imbricata TaxID=66713 RepID=A0AA88YMT5_PINIB|nr:hypothetical protein FSP39_001862 [Pinctada imbricata]